MNHTFDVDIAVEYGLNCAIILENLNFWIAKNEANEVNFHDGYYWTYNSVKAFKKLFPYISERQISSALSKLEENGIIVTGNYNTVAYDRTKWYAITKKGKSIMQKCKMEDTKKSNGFVEKVEPIPYINTDINTDNINSSKLEQQSVEKVSHNDDYKMIVSYLNEKAGTNYRPTTKKTQSVINARLNENFTIDDFKTVIDAKCDQWLGTKMQEYLRPETLFGTKFESYLNSKPCECNRFDKPNVPTYQSQGYTKSSNAQKEECWQ